MARFILALLLLALVPSGAHARQGCVPESRVVADVSERWPPAVIERLSGDEAQALADAYNAVPPRTDCLVVTIFHDGCLVHFEELEPDVLERLRREV